MVTYPFLTQPRLNTVTRRVSIIATHPRYRTAQSLFNIGRDRILIKCRNNIKLREASQCFETQKIRKMRRNPALSSAQAYISVHFNKDVNHPKQAQWMTMRMFRGLEKRAHEKTLNKTGYLKREKWTDVVHEHTQASATFSRSKDKTWISVLSKHQKCCHPWSVPKKIS